MAVNKETLSYNPADPTGSDNVGSYVRASDGSGITSTTVGSKTSLDIHVASSSVTFVGVTAYNEITSVANSITTSLLTYTATSALSLNSIDVSGTNIAMYEVLLNGTVIDKKRTYFGGELNEVFRFNNFVNLVISDVILVRVTHYRPTTGDFNARIALQQT